jgi:hypothetical protein
MKKIIPFLFVLFAVACEKFPPEHQPKEIDTKITDLKGAPIKEGGAGTPMKLTAPEFKELNKQGLLLKDGYIAFDKVLVKIQEAADDYILTSLPVMNFIDSRYIDIRLYIGNYQVAILCRTCFFYRSMVTGTIFSGFTGGATDGSFYRPAEMIHDAAGNIYVIDQLASDHDVIIKVSSTGINSVFAGAGDVFGRLVGIGIDESRGLLYVSDATAQQVKAISLAAPSTITVLAGSGTAGNADGTGTAASFRFGAQAVDNFGSSETGQGLTVDASGNIYVGENQTASLASQVRRITPAGVVTTVPGTLIVPTMGPEESAMPSGIALNGANEIFTTSGSSGFYQGINKFTTAGVFSRFAGKVSFEGLNDGFVGLAQFSYPKALRYFNTFFYVADGTNGALRRVNASGRVITLAGVGHENTNRFSGTGSFVPPLEGSYLMEGILALPDTDYYETAASVIRMDQAGGVAVVNSGLIYVADYGYKCIWKITIR